VIEIAVRQCRSSGIDCKVHGLSVRGRLRSDADDGDGDELVVNPSAYLASDGEDDSVAVVDTDHSTKNNNNNARARQSAAARGGPRDVLTNVLVWGLNDKDQLGGPKGSKVHAFLSFRRFITAAFVVVFFHVSGVKGSCAKHLSVKFCTIVMLLAFVLVIVHIPSLTHSFIPDLKSSFSASPSHRSLPFLLQD